MKRLEELGISPAPWKRVKAINAAKAAGLDTVPVMVFTGITEEEAQQITRAENEVRLGVSPFEDAKLIEFQLQRGFSQKEIAAMYGKPEAFVCRRAKLCSLIPELREFDGKLTTDAMERLAAYPVKIQEGMVKSVKARAKSGAVRWDDIGWEVRRATNDLDCCTAFDAKKECANCPNRTGAQPDLFGGPSEDGDELGECLDRDCYARKEAAAFDQKVREKAGVGPEFKCWELSDGIPVIGYDVKAHYPDVFTEKPRKSSRCVYYHQNWNGDVDYYCFGASRTEVMLAVAKANEAKKAEKDKLAALERERAEKINAASEAADVAEAALKAPLANIDGVDGWTKLVKKFVTKDAWLARAAAEFLDMDYRGEETVAFILAYKSVRDHFGITPKMVKAYKDAQAAYDQLKAEEAR